MNIKNLMSDEYKYMDKKGRIRTFYKRPIIGRIKRLIRMIKVK